MFRGVLILYFHSAMNTLSMYVCIDDTSLMVADVPLLWFDWLVMDSTGWLLRTVQTYGYYNMLNCMFLYFSATYYWGVATQLHLLRTEHYREVLLWYSVHTPLRPEGKLTFNPHRLPATATLQQCWVLSLCNACCSTYHKVTCWETGPFTFAVSRQWILQAPAALGHVRLIIN